MADIIPPAPVDAPFASYNWQDWYIKIRNAINNGATIMWSQITNFTGSNLNQLATRNHVDLQNVLGNGQYHVSLGQSLSLNSGLSLTIVTAKLTAGGTNGSMTFANGILTAQTAAT